MCGMAGTVVPGSLRAQGQNGDHASARNLAGPGPWGSPPDGLMLLSIKADARHRTQQELVYQATGRPPRRQ
jgi:hypothetical protein